MFVFFTEEGKYSYDLESFKSGNDESLRQLVSPETPYGYNVSCALERLCLMINFLLELAVKGHPYSQMIKIWVRRYFLADLSGAPNDNFWKISVRKTI